MRRRTRGPRFDGHLLGLAQVRRAGLPIGVVVMVALVAGLVAISATPNYAEADPLTPAIDIRPDGALLASNTLDAKTMRFLIACGFPIEEMECDLDATLHLRPEGSSWKELGGLVLGLGASFPIVLPDVQYVDYYLEVTESVSGTTTYFPTGGAATPLTLHVVAPGTQRELPALPFGSESAPDATFRLAWGSAPGLAGVILGNEGSTIGPQGIDVDEFGNVSLLDQLNNRIQIFDPSGVLLDVIPIELGPLGDIARMSDGSYYVVDGVPDGAGSAPVVHHITPGAPFSTPSSVVTEPTLDEEPVLISAINDVAWIYGGGYDAWTPATNDVAESVERRLTTARPTDTGYLVDQVSNWSRLDLVPLDAANSARITVSAPPDRAFGELAVVEPDGNGGYLVVIRTWQEDPLSRDHHEFVHLSSTGDIIRHFGIANGEFAETASLSQFRIGDNGDLYHLYSDQLGVEVRRFDL